MKLVLLVPSRKPPDDERTPICVRSSCVTLLYDLYSVLLLVVRMYLTVRCGFGNRMHVS